MTTKGDRSSFMFLSFDCDASIFLTGANKGSVTWIKNLKSLESREMNLNSKNTLMTRITSIRLITALSAITKTCTIPMVILPRKRHLYSAFHPLNHQLFQCWPELQGKYRLISSECHRQGNKQHRSENLPFSVQGVFLFLQHS